MDGFYWIVKNKGVYYQNMQGHAIERVHRTEVYFLDLYYPLF